jgi:DNA-directed RNA polymerase subunit N (RpoN/RPB10)
MRFNIHEQHYTTFHRLIAILLEDGNTLDTISLLLRNQCCRTRVFTPVDPVDRVERRKQGDCKSENFRGFRKAKHVCVGTNDRKL